MADPARAVVQARAMVQAQVTAQARAAAPVLVVAPQGVVPAMVMVMGPMEQDRAAVVAVAAVTKESANPNQLHAS